jgi:hypothetical protein
MEERPKKTGKFMDNGKISREEKEAENIANGSWNRQRIVNEVETRRNLGIMLDDDAKERLEMASPAERLIFADILVVEVGLLLFLLQCVCHSRKSALHNRRLAIFAYRTACRSSKRSSFQLMVTTAHLNQMGEETSSSNLAQESFMEFSRISNIHRWV